MKVIKLSFYFNYNKILVGVILLKHVYYGIKEHLFVIKDSYQLSGLKASLEHAYTSNSSLDYYKSEIKKEIENLKNNRYSSYIKKEYITIDNEVFIAEKEHDHVLEVGDEVKIGKHQGNIVNRCYDLLNDTMYYYTDIIVISIDEEVKNQMKAARDLTLKELQVLYREYFDENNKNKNKNKKSIDENNGKKKGFWEKLFV